MEDHKQKHKEYNLRYRMKKRGYLFPKKQKVAYLPEDSTRRSMVQEKHLQTLGYEFQYNLFNF